MPNILSKKTIYIVVLGAILVGIAGSASAGFFDFVKEGRSLIWPAPRTFDISVTSPNGGERWVKGETYAITWDINDASIQDWLNRFEPQNNGNSDNLYPIRRVDILAFLINDRNPIPLSHPANDQIREFYPRPSSVFIGRAKIRDRQMNWSIPKNIPARDGYKVRLVAVWGVVNRLDSIQGVQGISHLPYGISDESNRPFSIVNPEPIPTPTPAPVDVEQLLRQIEQMRRELNVMKQSLTRMDSILIRMEQIIRVLIGR